MSQRSLLVIGLAALAASLVWGVAGVAGGATAVPSGWFGLPGSSTVTIDTAQRSVQTFLDRTGNRDLTLDELMEFQDNFYALVKEKSTGIGAFELLVAKGNGAVTPEPGPNMMWNTKYGMRGAYRGGPTGAMTVTADDATGIAQRWLDASFPGAAAGTPDAFYGYYTFHFEKSGRIAGMLSVNGYGGQVWYHTWHGAFIQARD